MLPDVVLRYADHEEAVLDVHLPRGSLPAAAVDTVVVLVHGGFWKARYDRRHTRPMARALAETGRVVATPEYRRVGNGGGWPVTASDLHLAVTRLPGLLESIGVAPAPLLVAGHSAGGHLALWLATTDVPIRRVVGLAPVCDLGEAIRLGLGDHAARAFLGDHDPVEADPMTLLAQRPAAEVVIVHGERDDDVPVTLSRGLAAAHPWVDLREVPGGHFGPIDPDSDAWPTVLDALSPGR
jgi:acetyl esterase/lipase